VRAIIAAGLAALACWWPAVASAQQHRFEVGAQVPVVNSGEFDDDDIGIGGRFSWHPSVLVGFEGEIDVYPRDFPASHIPFARSRTEGLFGGTAGPVLGRWRPFARLRPGFVKYRRAPIVCILIFPPPLECALASGRTLFALDVGGGVELFATGRTFVRVDAGARFLRYPVAFDNNRVAHREPFFGHDLRVAFGGGMRF
jgi:hypothetical protein